MSRPTLWVIIPAAGMGKRMNAGVNKQYLSLRGVPILGRTIRFFDDLDRVDRIVVVVPGEEIPYCQREVIERLGIGKVSHVVSGGSERQESVSNALHRIDAADDDIVLIHDGVRPFVTATMVEDLIASLAGADGAIVAVPVKDTVKVVQGGVVTATPERSTLHLAQTPQGFRYRTIRDAYKRAADEGFIGTDDASLVERVGGKIAVVQGSYRNIKITTPEDMLLAEAFCKEEGS
ncbi:MAG: 2-C-methyl-D-erythritol 4-phosphate cytidylyltransferase [Desulfuromonadia bacterium]